MVPLFLAFSGGGFELVVRQEFALALWWGLALAILFGRWPRTVATPMARIALGTVCGLVVWTALSLLWTESAERTYAELARVLGLGGAFALTCLAVNARNWRAAAAGVCAAALVLPVFAVASRLFPQVFGPALELELDRLAYPLEYWNAVACWSAMALGVSLALSSGLRWSSWRAVSLGLAPVAGTAIYLTYSRAGIAVAALAVATVIVLSSRRGVALLHALAAAGGVAVVVAVIRTQPEIVDGTGSHGAAIVALALLAVCSACAFAARPTLRMPRHPKVLRLFAVPRRLIAPGLAVVIAVSAGTVVLFGPDVAADARQAFTSSGYPAVEGDPAARLTSLEGSRDEVWGSAWRAFESEPFGGIGAGAFDFWWARDISDGEQLRDAHSLYLEMLAELGVVGLALVLAFIAAILLGGVAATRGAASSTDRSLGAALLAAVSVFAVYAAVDWIWESTAVSALALIAGAVGLSSVARPRRSRARIAPGRVGLAALAVLAGVVQVPGIVSKERERASAAALATGRSADAVKFARDAVTAQPWAASPHAALSIAATEDENLELAVREARKAVRSEPTNWRHRYLLAAALGAVGDDSAAAAALESADDLYPGTEPSQP